MKHVIAFIVFIAGIALALYVGLWIMFIQPIMACCAAFDAGALTGTLVGITVLKCFFASLVGVGIAWISTIAAGLISGK